MSTEIDQEWEDFKIKFEKIYKDAEEEKICRQSYINNKNTIEEHNKKFNAGEVTWELGITAFADYGPNEYPCRCGGKTEIPGEEEDVLES